MMKAFRRLGWCQLGPSRLLAGWVAETLPAARDAVADVENRKAWLRCGGTWFAGVNVLPNDGDGRLPGGPALPGDLLRRVAAFGGPEWRALDRAQVSVCYPGYPQPMAGESAAAFRFRRDRDAAHLDGLLREGPDRRRYLREHHAFILGIPLTASAPDAAPLVVWKGSHEIIRAFLRDAFASLPEERWGEVDLTDAYQAVRRRVFENCRRVEVTAAPGAAYAVHRLAIHGVAPWPDNGGRAARDGRMIAYFRPATVSGPRQWLEAP